MYDDDTTTKQQYQSQLANGITGPVVVPLLQALITGFLAGICTAAVVSLIDPRGPWFTWFLIAWPVSTLAAWLAYRARWQYVVEKVLGVDLDGDGYVGEPIQVTPAPDTVRLELIRDNGHRHDFIDMPHRSKLAGAAPGLIAGWRTFSEGGVKGYLKRDEFLEVRDEFLARGMARWRIPGSPNQGVELTGPGKAALRALIGDRGDIEQEQFAPVEKYLVQAGDDPDAF